MSFYYLLILSLNLLKYNLMNQNGNNVSKYLIINDKDSKFGLYVNTVGSQSIKPEGPYPPRNHPLGYYFSAQEGRVLHEYQLVYITAGQGTFSNKDEKPIDIHAGMLLFLQPGLWHTYCPLSKTGWNEYFIGYNGLMADNLIKNEFFSAGNQVIDIGLNEEIVSLYTKAIEVAKADKTAVQQQLAGITLHLIGLVLAITKNKYYEIDDWGQKIEKSKIWMREHLSSEIDLEELASNLNTSYSWFRKIFKDYTGYAPAKYYQELKLHKAKELLAETNSPIKEIAYNLGYSNSEHFFTLFKKNTGQTPTEFRYSSRILRTNQ